MVFWKVLNVNSVNVYFLTLNQWPWWLISSWWPVIDGNLMVMTGQHCKSPPNLNKPNEVSVYLNSAARYACNFPQLLWVSQPPLRFGADVLNMEINEGFISLSLFPSVRCSAAPLAITQESSVNGVYKTVRYPRCTRLTERRGDRHTRTAHITPTCLFKIEHMT